MDHRSIADRLAADIVAGRIRAGERLPPQREFARRHGIAASTAARVYGELVRRGLAVGEVGRGTFVRAAVPGPEPAAPASPEPEPSEPGGPWVDLDVNLPVLAGQAAALAPGLARALRPDALGAALRPVGPRGDARARETAVALLSRTGWSPDPRHVLFAGNGRQAIAGAIAALVPVGGRLGVEALTYPVVKAIAGRLGVTLVPLAMDAHGLVPDALRSAHRAAPLRAVYLQPTLHNPLGVTMPAARREEVADLLGALEVPAIEDTIYAFLRDDAPPLAALAHERVILVDSLTKRLAPGLTLGFAASPPGMAARLGAAFRAGGWTATGLALTAATGLIGDGSVAAIAEAKRRDAAARQQIAGERLAGFAVRADARSYHSWWELPPPWRADTFVAAAARSGIAVTPGAAFAVARQAPDAVRLALGSPTTDRLSRALEALAALARGNPDDTGIE